MAYNDTFFSPEDRYSVGIEDRTSRCYVSIPVSNGPVDYEERYAITPSQYQLFLADRVAAIEFVGSCRRRECDDLLMEKPGWNRGTPV
ncbi:hypothetical protein [Mycolicibacter acidiphilus]|uniref:hypothetical protein n=1 Tax=Mycolicibacter acidiphilus TaxID=2835306 RepID=UPI002022F0F8|nr:hypothetical protein [Mycolicibacter acidiphilus]